MCSKYNRVCAFTEEAFYNTSYICWLHNFSSGLNSNPGLSEKERASISGILDTANTHSETIGVLEHDHASQCTSIEQKALETFQQRYMVCCLS